LKKRLGFKGIFPPVVKRELKPGLKTVAALIGSWDTFAGLQTRPHLKISPN